MMAPWAIALAGLLSVAPSYGHEDPDTRAELERLQTQVEQQADEIDRLRDSLDAVRAQIDGPAEAPALDKLALGQLAQPPFTTQPIRAHAEDGAIVVRGDQVLPTATAYGEDLVVEGHVRGNATAFGGDVVVRSTGLVDGDAVSFGGSVAVDDGGEVRGNRVATLTESSLGSLTAMQTGGSLLETLYKRLVFFLSFAGAGVLVVGLFPGRVQRISEVIRQHPLRSMTLGASLTIALLVLAVLFAVLIIPIPVSLMLLAVLGLSWLMGFVALCQSLGDRLPFEQKHHGRWFAFVVGTLVITFVSALPAIGFIVVIGASMLGMGAALTSAFGSR